MGVAMLSAPGPAVLSTQAGLPVTRATPMAM